MRDAERPAVTLGQELQLNLIELRKTDRLQHTGSALGAWITLFEHWQELPTQVTGVQDFSLGGGRHG